MNIGIDGNEANIKNRVGVNEYAYQIIWGLYNLQKNGQNSENLIVYLKNKPLDDLPKPTKNFNYKIIPGDKFWIIKNLMPYLFKNKSEIDVLFSPNHYTIPFSPIPRVVSFMDLGYLENSAQFTKKVFWQLKWWSAMSIYVSKYIISISEATKKDIVRHYPFSKDKISVTLLGYDKKRFNTKISSEDVRRIKKRYSIVDDYILYLGTLKPSKNVERLVEAFAKVVKKHPKIKLVIAGKKGWLYENIYQKAEKLGINNSIVYTGFFPEEDKPAIYKGAKVFAMPSLTEGFGFDVVYAMATGVPVVASDKGSLPEVLGEAGEIVDPYNVDSIVAGLNKVLTATKDEYNSMVDKGLKQVAKFSWETASKKTLEILKKC